MKGFVEVQNSPAAHWNALMSVCTPQIPCWCCSSCQHWCSEFRPHFMVLFAPVPLTERIPLWSLGGAYILYREQQRVSVRPMSGFWLRLRGRNRSTQLQVTKFWAWETCIISSIVQPWQKCLPKLNENWRSGKQGLQHSKREREAGIYPAAAGCFRRIPEGLSFPEGAGAFSCLQLVLLCRAAECRLCFWEHNTLKCNRCETVSGFLGSSLKHPLPARSPGCRERL